MDSHAVYGTSKTEQQSCDELSHALCFAWTETGPSSIQDRGQALHDTDETTRHTKSDGILKLDLNVAEAVALPPVEDIVCRPEKSVDEIEEIRNEDPEDERCSGDVAVPNVPDDRRSIDNERNQRQCRDCNRTSCDWIGCDRIR